MKTPVILLVDDEESIINSLRGSFEDEGYIVLCASDGHKALEIVKSQQVDTAFLDIWLPGMDGMETLKAIKDYDAAIEIVMMTGHGNVNTAVQAVKQGAFDFLEKPFSLDAAIDIIKKIKEKQQAPSTEGKTAGGGLMEEDNLTLTGETPDITAIKELVPDLAASEEHILVQGEIGIGKETLARLIHGSSKRKSKPFLKLNCALYGSDDIEAELFGLRKGGAEASKKGSLKEATGGTLLLYSIDALPIEVQKKLTDYIAGAAKSKSSGARIIAASIRNIEEALGMDLLDQGLLDCFKQTVSMPSLKTRRADIPMLLNQFIGHFCKEYGFREKSFDDDALETLVNYDWPGNIKELKNLAEKLVVSVPTVNISSQDIPVSVRDEMQYRMSRTYDRYATMEEAEAAWRKNYLLYHLRKNERDIKKTSEKLNIKEKNLKKYIKDYNIVIAQDRESEMMFQRTLKRSMVLSGRGLHSGDKTGLILTPMPPNSGIIFGNISSGDTVQANIDYVISTEMATSLKNTSAVARTIEHLLATLHAYRISNLMIKINNEVPIMDGSSVDFCKIIEDAGIEEQDEPLDEVVVNKKYTIGEVSKKNKFITIEPADTFSIHYTLNYPKPVGRQEFTFILDAVDSFKREIAPARTFGFLKDIEALTEKGLADGGRLNNFILIDDEKIVNTDLRFPNEFVRHKILDMMGDLYLLGRPIKGKITANMTGHTENAELVRLLRDKMNLAAVGIA